MESIFASISYVLLFISLYFEIFLLVTFFEGLGDRKSEKAISRFPTVTIIVPCFNEERTISGTLLSLLRLNYPKDRLSIMVVDDGSTDRTQETLKRFAKRPQIKVFKKENGGKFTALNFALERIESDLVGCLDADSYVDPEALRRIVAHFEDTKTMAVTPAIKVWKPENILQRIQDAEYSLGLVMRNVLAKIGAVYITPGPFSIFRREVFAKYGAYRHAHNTEDLEIGLRMQTNGLKVTNAHNAYVYTVTPTSVKKLYKQRVRWIHGFLENIKDYRSIFFNPRYRDLGLFVLPAATLSIFSALYFTGRALLSVTTGLYDKLIYVQTAGIASAEVRFDPFFMNAGSLVFVTISLIALTVALIVLGRKMSDEKRLWGMDIVYFVFLYGFIAPLWLSKSVWNAALGKRSAWR
jgi:poly-beta-1,6-N-acetyl-D-glucosamine synthase